MTRRRDLLDWSWVHCDRVLLRVNKNCSFSSISVLMIIIVRGFAMQSKWFRLGALDSRHIGAQRGTVFQRGGDGYHGVVHLCFFTNVQ